MFTLASALVLLTMALIVVSNKAKACETVLRSVRIEVPPLMVRTLCQDAGNATLIISSQRHVWRETVQGFCNSYDLNIGETYMRHILKSDTITLYLMRLDHTLDAARVVVMSPEEVQQYRISVLGHQSTRFVLTVDNTCLKPKQEMRKEELGENDATAPALFPFSNGTISKLTSSNDQYLPEFSRQNGLPLELREPGLITETRLNDPNIGLSTSTTSTPKRVRGSIKHNSFRPSLPTTDTLETISSSIFLKSGTLAPRSLDNIPSSSSKEDSGKLRVPGKQIEENSELDKLEWMENRKEQFEKKMEYYHVYPSSENISDYVDYNTEVVDGVSKQTTLSATKIDELNKEPKIAETSNIILQQNLNRNETLENNLQAVTAKAQNVSRAKLLYRALNGPSIESSSADIASAIDTNVLGTSTATHSLTDSSNTLGRLPMFLFSANETFSDEMKTMDTEMDLTHSVTPSWPASSSTSVTAQEETNTTSNDVQTQQKEASTTSETPQPTPYSTSTHTGFTSNTNVAPTSTAATSGLSVIPITTLNSIGTSTTSSSILATSDSSGDVSSSKSETSSPSIASSSTTSYTPSPSTSYTASSSTTAVPADSSSTFTAPPTTSSTTSPTTSNTTSAATSSTTSPTTSSTISATTSSTTSAATSSATSPTTSSTTSATTSSTTSPTTSSTTSPTTSSIASPTTSSTTSHTTSSTTSPPTTSRTTSPLTISTTSPTTSSTASPPTSSTSHATSTSSATSPTAISSTVNFSDQTTTHSSTTVPSTTPKESTSTPATPISQYTSTAPPSSPPTTDSTAKLPITIPLPVDGQQSSTTSNQSGATEEAGKDDDTVWPVIIALVLGIPALVVIGIAVTVIHRRSRPDPQKVFAMKALRSHNSTPKLSATSSTIRTTLRLSTTSMEV